MTYDRIVLQLPKMLLVLVTPWFNSASAPTGIELMHMIRKGQLMLEVCSEMSFSDQFYALARKIRQV